MWSHCTHIRTKYSGNTRKVVIYVFLGIWERKSWQKLHKRENIGAVLCPPPLFLGDILNHILLLGKLKIKNVGREGEIKLIPL